MKLTRENVVTRWKRRWRTWIIYLMKFLCYVSCNFSLWFLLMEKVGYILIFFWTVLVLEARIFRFVKPVIVKSGNQFHQSIFISEIRAYKRITKASKNISQNFSHPSRNERRNKTFMFSFGFRDVLCSFVPRYLKVSQKVPKLSDD